MNKKELAAFLIENFTDEDGDLNLSSLDFSNFDGDVLLFGLKVKNDLWQSSQIVGGRLFQDYQRVKEDLSQLHQKVGGNLWQDFQDVKGDLFQDSQRVEGNLIQDYQTVKGKIRQDELRRKEN